MSVLWNLWHGCQRVSPGCKNCYVYCMDEVYGRSTHQVVKTKSFDLPVRFGKNGKFKIPSGELVYTCFSSDFLIEEADEWRGEAWNMIRLREDLNFLFITKRIDRLEKCLPPDWKDGYDNVHICCTVENQNMAECRLPIFIKAPIKQKSIVCEPLLEKIDLERYLVPSIRQVWAGGESGKAARVCDYQWILDLREQCRRKGVAFHFHQTGALLKKNGKIYSIKRKYQHQQARKAGIDIL